MYSWSPGLLKRYEEWLRLRGLSWDTVGTYLICHGSPSPELLKMYLKEKSVDIEELEELNFREKTSFGLRSTEKDIGFSRIVDMYTYAFLKSIDYTENCYYCRYASQSRVSDISLGDSWGSELSEEEKKKGISLVLCQTKREKNY